MTITRHWKAGGVALAGSIAAVSQVGAAEETWIGGSSLGLSDNAQWLDGSAPAAGGAADLTVRLAPAHPGTWIAQNDLGAPFLLNRLVLASDFASVFVKNISGN